MFDPNGLTIFLYLLDVLTQLKNFLGAVLGAGIFATILIGMGGVIFANEWDNPEVFWRGILKYTFKNPLVWLMIVVFLIIPSKDTLYMMAASEMGEEVLETEIAHKVQDYVLELIEGEPDANPNSNPD